jgi:hypothetical protein
MPNGTLSCGVLSRCHIVAPLKSKKMPYKPSDMATTRGTTMRRLACFGQDDKTIVQKGVLR